MRNPWITAAACEVVDRTKVIVSNHPFCEIERTALLHGFNACALDPNSNRQALEDR